MHDYGLSKVSVYRYLRMPPRLVSNACGRAEIYLIGRYAKTPSIHADDPGCIAVLLTRVMLYPCNLTL
jgi:hypothetical protein